MSSYLKLFQDFLQKKECDISRVALPEDEPMMTMAVEEERSSPTELVPTNNANNNSTGSGGINNKMEHSYTRDGVRSSSELITGLAPARTILVRRPPQCPSCHTHPLEEHELDDSHQAEVPTYNEISAKEAMNECARIAKYVKNNNADDDDWESRVNQIGWTNMQKTLFSKMVRILDNDQLGRLSNVGRQNEAMQRRVIVDKSASRVRKVLASVSWDARLTQWLHALLMDCLPSTYMASYLDILQTLKTKLPTLMDKMLFGRPMNISQELLAPVLKKQWEPIVTAKSRKLTHNAVIVALPAMPASGPVPNRLQKWYQHLATITQIVQVTMPMTSGHIARQPLDQIAEQIVSLTRVKIQELRNENPTRSIILIGFNAGSALALQVAMSESIVCVICMGFGFNTFNGARGAPDDRILDIKIPILFVIGQNSARTSTEEIESLREKMQSETSLVVVGSADDALRIPKSRRKIENVTQTMVDTMVVDEIYEFIIKIITNPPGPRLQSAITSVVYPKQSRSNSTLIGVGSDASAKSTPIQRKRKQDGFIDGEQVPSKTKFVPHIGRPRTRPLNPNITTTAKTTQIVTSANAGGKLQQTKTQISPNTGLSGDDLSFAMQTILHDANDPDAAIVSNESTQKLVTNFELVAQTSKTTPIKTTILNPLQKQTIIGSVCSTNTATTTSGAKIKMIPSNQFVQLKPPLQSQSKIYTIKTSAMLNQASAGGSTTPGSGGTTSIGSIVATTPNAAATGQQQIFTLKSPNGQTTQFVTAAPAAAQQKYTVVKNATGGTTLQLTTTGKNLSTGSNLDLSNIIDMPIIFADNDGNLTDSMAANAANSAGENASKSQLLGTTIKPNTSGVGQLIISQKIIKDATNPSTTAISSGTSPKGGTYVINKAAAGTVNLQTQQTTKPNKVVFINRNTMKPCPNIISRSNVAQLPKYTKVVVTNPKTAATTLVSRPSSISTVNINPNTSGTVIAGAVNNSSPIVSTVKQVNLQALKSNALLNMGSVRQSGILNVNTKSLPQIQIINSTASGSGVATISAANTAVTTTVGDKLSSPQIRNIVVKPGGLKQLPSHLKTQFFNRNLTVRKLVNIVPSTKIVTGTTASSITIAPTTSVSATALETTAATAAGTASPSSSSTNSIQTSPKIITLNPINPIATVAVTAATTISAQTQSKLSSD